VPPEVTLVAESAIRNAEDARRMAEAGAHALLVGEALVLSGDVEAKARELVLAEVEATP
jgi:indole-3-glycerol phosphate synthase